MIRKSSNKRGKKTISPKRDSEDTPSENGMMTAEDTGIDKSPESAISGTGPVGKPDERSRVQAPSMKTDTVPASSKASPSEVSRPHRRSGQIIGWLALVLALGALAGTAYLAFDTWRAGDVADQSNERLARLEGTLNVAREALDALQQRFDSLSARDLATVGELQSLERSFTDRLRDVESLSGRIGNLERSVSSLQGISSGARDAWLLAEAEYYMQIANVQLQLAGNPHLASLALSNADERLLQLADPGLTPVRRALADELRAIAVMEKPDIEGVTLTLASLAGVVDSLPLRQDVEVPEQGSDEIDPELSGIDRAVESVKRTVRGIVSVRRTDEAAQPLLAPDAVYFLRANVTLQLQAARIALLRNEKAVFEQSLDDAGDWLARYYDTDSAPVQSALATIAEIRNGLFSVTPPDISESLRLLRQHASVSGFAPSLTTEPD